MWFGIAGRVTWWQGWAFLLTFVSEDYSSYFNNYGRTEDCGAGLIFFSIDELTEEAYDVWVGDIPIGNVQLPSEPQCYEAKANN